MSLICTSLNLSKSRVSSCKFKHTEVVSRQDPVLRQLSILFQSTWSSLELIYYIKAVFDNYFFKLGASSTAYIYLDFDPKLVS